MSNRIHEPRPVDSEEVLTALPETIVQVDDGLLVMHVNHPASGVFVSAPRRGQPLARSLDSEATALIRSLVDSARRTGDAEGEYRMEHKSYRVTVTRLQSAPVFVIVFRDVTSRRRTEQVLMEMMRGKSSVLASVGNELKEPLNSVIAYANLLARTESELEESHQQALVEHMAGQAWDLARIIDDLLAVAHTEIGDLHVADVPLNLFANTAQVLESMGERGRLITVTGNRSTTASGDPARFRHIVRNLLSNALTHGSEPVTIDVSVSGDRALLKVKDRGPGVPAEVESQELFARPVDDPATAGRIGIGLWVASELAHLMKGHVDYRREYGLTVFEVDLGLLSTG